LLKATRSSQHSHDSVSSSGSCVTQHCVEAPAHLVVEGFQADAPLLVRARVGRIGERGSATATLVELRLDGLRLRVLRR